MYGINIAWGISVYIPYVRRKDAFYYQWMHTYPKTEFAIHMISYAICFQCFRLAVCRFFSLGYFSAALHRDRIISRMMNIFTIVYIVFVCLFIIALNMYCIFALSLSQSSLYHHIECWIITAIHVALLVAEISTKNRINRYDSFMLKSVYHLTKDQIERNKYKKVSRGGSYTIDRESRRGP